MYYIEEHSTMTDDTELRREIATVAPYANTDATGAYTGEGDA